MLFHLIRRLFAETILLFVLWNGLHAQSDFNPGYVIMENGDTVHGSILFDDARLYKICTFRNGVDSAIVRYTPLQIKAYRFDGGKYFISKKVPYEGDTAVFFLEYLIKGKANIYYMRLNYDHYYIETDKNKLIELSETERTLKAENGAVYVQPKLYKGKLKAEFSDCPAIFPEINRLSLNQPSLIKLAEDYHKKMCSDESCLVFEQKRDSVKLNIGIYAGISANAFKFGPYITTDYGCNGLLGVKFEFQNILSWSKHTSLSLNVVVQQFSKCHSVWTYFYNSSANGQVTYFSTNKAVDITMKTTMIKVPILVDHTFPVRKFKPMVGLGFENLLVIRHKEDFELQSFIYHEGRTIPEMHWGFTGMQGTMYNLKNGHAMFLTLNYERTKNYFADSYYQLRNNLFSVELGYNLFKSDT